MHFSFTSSIRETHVNNMYAVYPTLVTPQSTNLNSLSPCRCYGKLYNFVLSSLKVLNNIYTLFYPQAHGRMV
jgi:hypothetical protein